MAQTWDKFETLTLPYLSGCPTASINVALAESAAEFCERTQIWRMQLASASTVAATATYSVTLPGGTDGILEAIVHVALDNRMLKHIDSRRVNPASFLYNGMPNYFALTDDTNITFYPTPERVYTYTSTVAVKPSRTAVGVPDFIYQTHANTIASGAIMRLMRVVGKSWSNPGESMNHMQLFERGISKARVREYRNTPSMMRLSRI